MKNRGKKTKGFPTLQFLLLVIGLVWLVEPYITLSASAIISPIILIVLAIGWIINFYRKR